MSDNRPRGERHPLAKLTDREVEQIREMHDSGEAGYRKIARIFDIHRATVADIVKGRRR